MFYIFAGKLIFRGIEIDFSEWVNMREPWQGRGTGDGSRGLTPGDGAEFPVGASNQILLMKWGNRFKPNGPEAKGILPWAS